MNTAQAKRTAAEASNLRHQIAERQTAWISHYIDHGISNSAQMPALQAEDAQSPVLLSNAQLLGAFRAGLLKNDLPPK